MDVTYFERPLTFHKSTAFNKNGSKRFISLEIEVAECEDFEYVDEVCEKWSSSVVSDGSLTTGVGFEINTAPTNGDLFIKHMKEISSGLKKSGAVVDRSTGLHIHIDGRDMDHYDIVKLATLYASLEDGLFSLVPQKRRYSDFCKPCGKSYVKEISSFSGTIDYEQVVAKTIYKSMDKKVLQQQKGRKYSEYYDRFSALNLHSLTYRGTAECRLHTGTTNATKMINWGLLWSSILDYAKQNKDFNLPKNSFDAVLAVAPNEQVRQWCKIRREKFL